MAAKKKKPIYKPSDYLRGSKTIGGKYTAWDTYGQGRPDFGKGSGPGEPYHEVQKNVKLPKPKPRLPSPGKFPKPTPRPNNPSLPPFENASAGPPGSFSPRNPRIEAIRRRLGWM
jgi:hypothetical protein